MPTDREEADYRNNPLLSVTQVLKDCGLYPPMDFVQPEDLSFGQYGHRAVELFERGELRINTLDPLLRPRLDAWQDFKAKTGWESAGIEEPLYNKALRLKGRPDFTGKMRGQPRVVLDLKMGVIADVTALQLAGYEVLLGGEWERIAVQLKADGKYSLKHFTDYEDRATFLGALRARVWALDHNGR